MRPRSRGVSCQSFDELVEIVNSEGKVEKNPALLNQSSFSTIQEYLQCQQQESITQPQTNQYFLFEADQLRAQEEDQLTKKPLFFIKSCLAFLCPCLPQVYQNLYLEKQQILGYKLWYPSKWSPFDYVCLPNLTTEFKSHMHQQLDHSLSKKTFSRKEERVRGFERGQIQMENESIRESNWPLDLVVYYNVPSEKKENQNQKMYNCQHKIWLIQQQKQYSELIKVYLDKSQHLFQVLQKESELTFREITPDQTNKKRLFSGEELTIVSVFKRIEQYLLNSYKN